MARRILKNVTMLMLLLTMALVTAVATANGQSQHRVNASVPFEFIVGDKTLAAGEYALSEIASGDALAIRSADSKNRVIRLTQSVQLTCTWPCDRFMPKDKSARLVFHRYGNTYFLSQVWEGGDSAGRELIKSSQEHVMKRELSRIATNNRIRPTEVVILASVR